MITFPLKSARWIFSPLRVVREKSGAVTPFPPESTGAFFPEKVVKKIRARTARRLPTANRTILDFIQEAEDRGAPAAF
jgi:hypothetical protein